MKVKNISKRIMAGMLGGIALTTPLVLASCNSYEYVTEEDGCVMLNPDKMYSYDEVRRLNIVNVKTKINKKLYLTYNDPHILSGNPYNYYDFFTGKKIISCNSNHDTVTEGVELLSEEKIEPYLISYEMLKEKYSVDDLEFLFKKIKQDVYSNTNNKKLVKEK